MNYSIYLLPSADRDMQGLPNDTEARCLKTIFSLADQPRPSGSLKLTGEDGYRIRVGDYRILYRVDDHAQKIFIYRIKHRKEGYR